MSTDADAGTDTPGVTDADRERMAALCRKHTTITAATCAEWRRRVHDGATVQEIAAGPAGRPWSSVCRHVYGRCSHDHDVAPAASEGRGGGGDLSREECVEIHRLDGRGLSNGEIALEVDRSEASVWRHLNGRCSHDHGDGDREAEGRP